MRHLRIRTYLLILVLVSALPFIAFSAVLVTRTAAIQTKSFGRDVVAVARALSLAIDSRIAVQQAALEVLGRSRALADGDLAVFSAELQDAAALLDSPMSLSRADGQQILNTARLPGAALPRRSQPEHVAQVVADGRAMVSGMTRDALDGRPQATVDVPVPGGGQAVRWVLAGTVQLASIEALLNSQRLPPGWVGAVVDQEGTFLARTRDNEATVGTSASKDWTGPARTQREGWVTATTFEGEVTYAGFVRSGLTGWTVAIGVPRAVVWAPLLRVLLPLAGFGTALTLLAAWAAVAVARRIARPFVALARQDADPSTLDLFEAQEVAVALQAADAERRAAEAALRDSEAELRAARELSPQAPWTADAQGHLLTNSPRVSDLTGTPARERRGAGWLDVVHPQDRAAAAAAWALAVRTGLPYDHTFRVQGAPGAGHRAADWLWLRSRASPRLGADGCVLRWYGTTEDVDDRVRAQAALEVSEARLRLLTEDLEAQVAAEVVAREAAQAALHQSQRMEALGQLAAGVAHDFNNVLQAVGGALALILRTPSDSARVERVAAMARDAVARGAAITGRMLSLARRADLRAGPIDVAALLTDLQVVLAATLGGGVKVEVHAAEGLPPVLADRGQLETVLINLATNARDAMPRGGTLRLSAALSDGQVRIMAEDNGAGMTPGVLARAQEPFFTTKPPGAGTGLGLAMAHGFAGQSGGDLQIRSVPGQGTAVTLVLPAAIGMVAEA